MSNSNEFHFHDSKIANFNLGQQIGTINASIGLLNQQGAEAADLARSLEIIRDAVVAAPDADEKRKKHILDSLSLIGAEAEKPKDDRQDGILQPVLTNLEKLLSTTSSLENLWHTHGPAITQFFSYMLGTS